MSGGGGRPMQTQPMIVREAAFQESPAALQRALILRGFHVQGYGVWRDFTVDGLSPGLNVFHGPNEAGKSTIHAFIRHMLFGMPDGRFKEKPLLPLDGGEHGGRLFLSFGLDAATLSRTARSKRKPQLLAADGSPLPLSTLDDWLRGVDAQLFRNLFAFGIEELASLDTLSGEEIGARIFDAGLEGAGRSVTAWRAELRKRKEAELKPRAGRLRELARVAAEKHRALKHAVEKAGGHGPLLEREEDLEKALREAAATDEGIRQEIERWKSILGAWPAELRRREAAAVIADGAEVAQTLPDALGDFDRTVEEAERCRGESRRLSEERLLLQREREALPLRPGLVALGSEARRLFGEAELHADRLRRLELLGGELRSKEERLDERLAELGEGWTVERAIAVDRSVARRDVLIHLEGGLSTAAAAEVAAASEVERCEGERNRLQREWASLEAVLAGAAGRGSQGQEEAGAPMERGPMEWEAIEEARGALAGIRVAKVGYEEASRGIEELRHLPPGARGAGGLAWGAIALLAAVSLWAFSAGQVAGGAAALASAGVWAAIALRAARAQGNRRRERRLEAEKARDACLGELRVHGGTLGFESLPPDSAEIEKAAARLERAAADRRSYDERLREAGSLGSRVENAAAALASAGARWAEARERKREGTLSWQAHVADLGGAIGPAAARELLDRAERVSQARREIEAARREAAEIAALVQVWEEKVQHLLDRAGLEGLGRQGLSGLLEALQRSERAEARRLEIDRALAIPEKRLGSLLAEEQVARNRLAEILQGAGAADRSDLSRRIERWTEVEEARRGVRDAERLISEQLGMGAEAEASREELRSGEKLHWEERLRQSQAAAADAAQALRRLHEELALSRHERTELERSADVPRLAAEGQQVQAEIAGSVERYRVAALLEHLLTATLERFQDERQPRVLLHAGEAFARVTRGRYTGLRQPAGTLDVEAIDARGQVVASGALSRGTRDQLYLCLRLGLVEAFAERGIRLPLLMDDVLVNFDPDRADAMAEVLADVSRDNQILFFTCHPKTVGRLRGVAPGAALVDLGQRRQP